MLRQTLESSAFREQYAAAKPFPHGAVDSAFDPALLTAVRDELSSLEFTDKETDLYRFSQSPDLSSLGSKNELPALRVLRDALYAKETRQLVSDALQCGPLSDKVDMAAAVYSSGSHLLVHDDVIGTRKIAFIVYFTRQEDNWSEADGGCLELFDSETLAGTSSRLPALVPAKRILPLFNRLACFTVTPGVSFHAVQEVISAEKHRISIQGWYHAETSGAQTADGQPPSMKELRKQIDAGVKPFVPCSFSIVRPSVVRQKKMTLEVPKIDDADLEELKSIGVHPMYLDSENITVLADALKRQGVVRLAQFLLPPLADPLVTAIREADARDGLGLGTGVPDGSAGCNGEWTAVGPPHVRRLLLLNDEESDGTSSNGKRKAHRAEEREDADVVPPLEGMLRCIRDNLFRSPAFTRFVAAIISTSCAGTLNGRRDAIARYRPGLDYTLATVPSDGLEVDVRLTFCAAPEADDDDGEDPDHEEAEDDDEEAEEREEDLWASCEVGGFDSYIDVQEGDDSVAANDEDAVTNLPCQANCLTIAVRTTEQMHFVKYLQAVAPSSRVEVSTVYRVDEQTR